jgi:uncharacterized protein YggU (UPF0235/DUF167 family)
MIIDVLVKPGAKHPGVSMENGLVVVRVRERAVEGAANAACIRALCETYGVSARAVQLVHGRRSRRKRFVIGAR